MEEPLQDMSLTPTTKFTLSAATPSKRNNRPRAAVAMPDQNEQDKDFHPDC